MKIIVSKYIGPCFGVKSAISEVFSCKKKVKLLGEIAHNEEIMNKISKMENVELVHNTSEINYGDTVITRTHGILLDDLIQLKIKNSNIIDKTCPHVKFIHNIAQKCSGDKNQLIIVGNKDHPEVIGIKSRCHNSIIIDSVNDIKQIKNLNINLKTIVVSQTTFNLEIYNKICDGLGQFFKNLKIYNTICKDSINRKEELIKVSNDVDIIVVIGSKTSSNSTKLFNFAKSLKSNSIMISNYFEFSKINKFIFKNIKTIFITSGASVMRETIDRIISELRLTKLH